MFLTFLISGFIFPTTQSFLFLGCIEGGIDLCVVDSKGEVAVDGVILSITKDGNLFRNGNLNKNCGLKLSKHGKIRCTDLLYEPKDTKNTSDNKKFVEQLNEYVDFKDWKENPLDKEMIELINALNKYNIKTSQCCSGHGTQQAQISIDLSKSDLIFGVRQNRLIINWDINKELLK